MTNKKLQAAILAAAALRGRTGPALLDEATSGTPDDFWRYAQFAAAVLIYAPPAGRVGVPVRRLCQELAQRDGQQPECTFADT